MAESKAELRDVARKLQTMRMEESEIATDLNQAKRKIQLAVDVAKRHIKQVLAFITNVCSFVCC